MANVQDRKAVAKHELVDANAGVVDNEESARGIKYTLLNSGKSYTWTFDEANDNERRMLALFGAKTLATNLTSQVRQKLGDKASDEDQLNAVVERFGDIRNGTWVDRTREGGVGRAIDKGLLAQAMGNAQLAAGKLTQDQLDAYVIKALEKLEEDAAFVRKARQVPQVADEYIRLVGKPVTTATLDDLELA